MGWAYLQWRWAADSVLLSGRDFTAEDLIWLRHTHTHRDMVTRGYLRVRGSTGHRLAWLVVGWVCIGVPGWSVFILTPGPGDALIKGNWFRRDIRKTLPCATATPHIPICLWQHKAWLQGAPIRNHTCKSAWVRLHGYFAIFCGWCFGAQLCNETNGNYQVDFIDT